MIGKAIAYNLSLWDKLIIYVHDGKLQPENNNVEILRPTLVCSLLFIMKKSQLVGQIDNLCAEWKTTAGQQ